MENHGSHIPFHSYDEQLTKINGIKYSINYSCRPPNDVSLGGRKTATKRFPKSLQRCGSFGCLLDQAGAARWLYGAH